MPTQSKQVKAKEPSSLFVNADHLLSLMF